MAKPSDLRPKVERQLREYARRRVWADGLARLATGAIGIPVLALTMYGAVLLLVATITNSLSVATWFLMTGAQLIRDISSSVDPVSPTLVAALLALAVMNTGRVAGSVVASAAGWTAHLAVTWATFSLVALALPLPSGTTDLRGEHALTAVVLAFVSVVLAALIRELLPFNLAERKVRLRRTLTAANELRAGLRAWMAGRPIEGRSAQSSPPATGISRRSDVIAIAAWSAVVLASSILVGCATTSFLAGVILAIVCTATVGTVLVLIATTLRGSAPRGQHWVELFFPVLFALAGIVTWVSLTDATANQPWTIVVAAMFSLWAVLSGYAWLSGFAWWKMWPSWTLPAIATRLRLDQLDERARQLAKLRRAVNRAKTDTP